MFTEVAAVDAAVSGALHKMKQVLDTTFGREDDQRKGGGSKGGVKPL